MTRADYCPIGGEPCQSLCDTPCTTAKREHNPDHPYVRKMVGCGHGRLFSEPCNECEIAALIEKPWSFGNQVCLELMTLGFYKQFLSSLEALKKANKASFDFSGGERIAQAMQEIGVSEEKSTQIIECVGDVLEKHHLCWHDEEPGYTIQSGEVGALFKVDVSPAKAAELDAELAEALIAKDLDTEPFFVSFVGTAQ